jgi:chromosome segregation ATPase
MTQVFFPKTNPLQALQAWFLTLGRDLPAPSPYELSSYQNSASGWDAQFRDGAQRLRQELNREIDTPSPEDRTNLDKVNEKLRNQGKSPIDFAATTRQIEGIMSESGTSPKEKKEKIEALRKQLGLSKGEMKRLFTKRLSRIYKQKAEQLRQYRDAQIAQLQAQITQAEKIYGPNSPQVTELKRRETALRQTLDPMIQSLSERGKFYGSLYPSFWSKIGGFFKKLGAGILKGIGFLKPLLNFIPGWGQIARVVIGGLETVINMVRR